MEEARPVFVEWYFSRVEYRIIATLYQTLIFCFIGLVYERRDWHGGHFTLRALAAPNHPKFQHGHLDFVVYLL